MKGIRNFKTFCLSVVLVIGSLSVGYGQEWERNVKIGTINFASAITQTEDSMIWATGSSRDSVSGNLVGTVMKYNSNGAKVFIKNIPKYNFIEPIFPTNTNGLFANDGANNGIRCFDANGNIIWQKQDLYDSDFADAHYSQADNGNLIVTLVSKKVSDSTYVRSMLFDALSQELWSHDFIIPLKYQFIKAEVINNQLYLFLSREIGVTKEIKTLRYDNGLKKLVTIKSNTINILVNNIQKISNGFLAYNSYSGIPGVGPNILRKIIEDKIIWETEIANASDSMSVTKIIEDKNKNIVLLASWIMYPRYQYITVWDSLGRLKSHQRYTGNKGLSLANITESNDGYYLVCGTDYILNPLTNDYEGNAVIIKTRAAEHSSIISGKVFIDNNGNCKADSLEKRANVLTIKAQNEKGKTYYGIIQKNGYYNVALSGDSLTLTAQANSPYYQQTCTPATVKFTGANQTIEKDLFLQKTTDCPYTTVDIAARNFRPCFDAVLVVDFCNHGSAAAQNAYIEVKLDANLTYQSSTKTAIPKGNNLYRFDLGDLPIDSCGQFTITTKVACDNLLLGKTLCNVAHIYPDSICAPQDNGKIQVTGTCNGSTIDFNIKNVDAKAMKSSKNYIVIEDHVMFKQGSFNLNPNQSQSISVIAEAGKTYRLIAEQTNPIYGNLASVAFENCKVSATPSTGMINQFPQGDDSPFEDTDCRVVTASYDPNDKQAIPQGVGNKHFITKNTDIEYMIRFQNKGTDTAFLVIVKDTLSQSLDPASIIPGASSHPYQFDLTDRGIAKFIFSGINLPHQKVNDEGSNGFVKFRIKQRRDLPNGTVIKNKAAIYFDYNDPIITNETFHTIGENWALILPNKEIATENLEVKIYPNPFSESTRIEAQISEKQKDKVLVFNVLNANGSVIRSEIFSGNALDFQRDALQAGFYLYEIKSENKRLGTGKLVVF